MVVLVLDGEDFLVHKEDVFMPILKVPMEETLGSCPPDLLQSRSEEVSLWEPLIIPDEAQHWLDQYVQL